MEGWTPAPEGIGESPRPSGRERWGLCVSVQVPTEGPWTQYRMPYYHGGPHKPCLGPADTPAAPVPERSQGSQRSQDRRAEGLRKDPLASRLRPEEDEWGTAGWERVGRRGRLRTAETPSWTEGALSRSRTGCVLSEGSE